MNVPPPDAAAKPAGGIESQCNKDRLVAGRNSGKENQYSQNTPPNVQLAGRCRPIPSVLSSTAAVKKFTRTPPAIIERSGFVIAGKKSKKLAHLKTSTTKVITTIKVAAAIEVKQSPHKKDSALVNGSQPSQLIGKSAVQPVRSPVPASCLQEGNRVEVITCAQAGTTFDVVYDDGETETCVEVARVRAVGGTAGSPVHSAERRTQAQEGVSDSAEAKRRVASYWPNWQPLCASAVDFTSTCSAALVPLAAGIPPVRWSGGSGYVPKGITPCDVLSGHFALYKVPRGVACGWNVTWRNRRFREGKWRLDFSAESDVKHEVQEYLLDVILEMGLQSLFELETELDMQGLAPNLVIITCRGCLAGVVLVKEQGPNMLSEPIVLGELLNFLYLVQGFYKSGPVVGIVTTLEEWRFCWLPEDDTFFSQPDQPYHCRIPPTAAPPFGKNGSPFKVAPSLRNPGPRGIQQLSRTEPVEDLRGVPGQDEHPRRLMVSPIIYGCTQGPLLLSYAYTAVARMTHVCTHHQPARAPRLVFKLTKDAKTLTWHALDASHEPFIQRVFASAQYPGADVTELIAVEDLGRGGSGKVWLTASLSQEPGLCVLKFSNECDIDHLRGERVHWVSLYPHLALLVVVEMWSGAPALRMPFLAPIAQADRAGYREQILQLLDRCEKRGYVHLDVAWRNMGAYLPGDGSAARLVLFDFHIMAKFKPWVHKKWKEAALKKLYLKKSAVEG